MTDIVERLRAKADRLKFVEQFDEESLSKPVLLRDRQNLWEAADEIERLRAKEKDWTEVFEAQKSIIGRLTDTLREIKRENQHYNFGSKLVRIVDTALKVVP